jgi:hypothetical protein
MIIALLFSGCAHPGKIREIDTGEVTIDRKQGDKRAGFSCVVETNAKGNDFVIRSFDSVEVIEQKNKLVDTEQTFHKYSVALKITELCAWAVVIPGLYGFFYPLITGTTLEGENDRFHATFYDSFSMLNPFMNAFSGAISHPSLSAETTTERKSRSVKMGEPVKYEKRFPKGGVSFKAYINGQKYTGKTDLVGDFHIKSNTTIENSESLEINGNKVKIERSEMSKLY